jgi:hypothetical protein
MQPKDRKMAVLLMESHVLLSCLQYQNFQQQGVGWKMKDPLLLALSLLRLLRHLLSCCVLMA